jgi:hypothetical protein
MKYEIELLKDDRSSPQKKNQERAMKKRRNSRIPRHLVFTSVPLWSETVFSLIQYRIQSWEGGRSKWPVPVLWLIPSTTTVGKYILESCKRLDKVNEKCSTQLQHVSKVFHPLFLAIYLPIHHYGIHNSGGRRKWWMGR